MTAQLSAYGRLVADVQSKATNNGGNMAFSRMAVSLPCRATGEDATLWLSITAFGRQADALAKHQKGDLISASGTLQVNQWTAQDGGTQSGYGLVADSVISARTVRPGGGKKTTSGNKQQAQQQGHQQHPPEDWDQTPKGSIPF